jgi:drug/metabolite transporter (DMT)-like permease
MNRNLILPGILAIGIIVISFGSILIRMTAAASVLAIAAWRLGVASLVIAPIAVGKGALSGIGRQNLFLSAVSGVFLSLHFVFWIASLDYTSIASSVIFVSTSPIFVGLGSRFLLKEPPSRLLIVAIVLAIGGGCVVGWGDVQVGGSALHGDMLAVAGAIMASGYFLVCRRVRKKLHISGYALTTYGTAAAILMVVCLLTRTPLGGFPPSDYLWLVLLGLGPQLVGHTTLNWALKYLQAPSVSIVTLGEPIGATLLAYLFFGESLTPAKGIGGAIILLGIYLSLRTGAETPV